MEKIEYPGYHLSFFLYGVRGGRRAAGLQAFLRKAALTAEGAQREACKHEKEQNELRARFPPAVCLGPLLTPPSATIEPPTLRVNPQVQTNRGVRP